MPTKGRKLTQAQILRIVKDLRLYKVIAEDYGVTQSMISCIKRGRRRTNITGIAYDPKRKFKKGTFHAPD